MAKAVTLEEFIEADIEKYGDYNPNIALEEMLSALSMGDGIRAAKLQVYAECILRQLGALKPDEVNEDHIIRGEE